MRPWMYVRQPGIVRRFLGQRQLQPHVQLDRSLRSMLAGGNAVVWAPLWSLLQITF